MVNIEYCIRSISVNGTLDQAPKYSVTQAAKLCNISEHTLRYYDKLNLFPFLQRNSVNKRLFSDADIQWVKLIECLRNSNMSLPDIQHYVQLCLTGDDTLSERLEIITQQEIIMQNQIKEIKKNLKLLQFKKNHYVTVLSEQKTQH